MINISDIVDLIRAKELKKASEMIREETLNLKKNEFLGRLLIVSEINKKIAKIKFEKDKFERIKEKLKKECGEENEFFF